MFDDFMAGLQILYAWDSMAAIVPVQGSLYVHLTDLDLLAEQASALLAIDGWERANHQIWSATVWVFRCA